MTNSFDKATERAFKSLQRLRGISATYHIDEATSVDVIIVAGETRRDDIAHDGLVMDARSQDWLIHKNDLPEGLEPVRAHWIEARGEKFELAHMDEEPPFRFHNPPTNSIYRLHTFLVEGISG